ncbi:hypothetical protein GWI33_015039 [Rhynchophorus ferrugineus]|uniref:Uncharacterized protein n=1 Tax=Rhynchophorus ferrugineus TaxID=354439 RepID=A0A834I5U5_RHYFE|nr:hypothetical protein GWI33_015039 [Rhynchophorus ferrugineus]
MRLKKPFSPTSAPRPISKNANQIIFPFESFADHRTRAATPLKTETYKARPHGTADPVPITHPSMKEPKNFPHTGTTPQ